MFKRLKDIFLYPVSDATWLGKMSSWWILYVFYLTIPILGLHFRDIVEKTIRHPEDDTLPEVDQTVKGWAKGMGFVLCLFTPILVIWVVAFALACSPSSHQPPDQSVMLIGTGVVFLYCLLLPAIVLRLATLGLYSFSVFNPKEIIATITLNFGEYLLLLVAPAVVIATVVAVAFQTPLVMAWIPVSPLLIMSYARALGLYYRANAIA